MKKIIYILLLILSMGGMYYFSSQEGEISSKQSHMVVEVVDNIIDEAQEKITLKDKNLINLKDKIKNILKSYDKNTLVRKAAHFGMYAAIGGFMMIVIYLFSKQIIFSACISFTLTFLYAVFDERRQLSIAGRAGSLLDVFIDSSGALLAIVIISCIFSLCKGFRLIFKREKDLAEEI